MWISNDAHAARATDAFEGREADLPQLRATGAGIAQPKGPILVGIEFSQQPGGSCVEGVELDHGQRVNGFATRTRGAIGQHSKALLVS